MNAHHLSPLRKLHAFTLIELLVSTALIALLMGLLLTTVNQSQRVMIRTTAKVKQFQAARAAFDVMTRRLSQAKLNTYYRAFDSDSTSETSIYSFTRESELQFFTGPAATSANSAPGIFSSPAIANLNQPADASYPTHSVFFQAPMGLTVEQDPTVTKAVVPRFRDIDQALTGVGYFIEHGPDPAMPGILRKLNYPDRRRFRLMELDIPTERLKMYSRPLDTTPDRKYRNDPQILDRDKADYVGLVDTNLKIVSKWKRALWMEEGFSREAIPGASNGTRFTYARAMAEDVFALVILPKLALRDRKTPDRLDGLAPNYCYDSWRIMRQDPKAIHLSARYNQLPPIVQVTMMVMDEPSSLRIQDKYKDKPPEWSKGLFTTVTDEDSHLQDVAKLEKAIAAEKIPINYRIFTTDVVIRGSKWSRD